MAWEIEHHYLDLAEMEHVTSFIERGVVNKNGQPARHLLQVRLGDHYSLNEKGELLDNEGKPYDLRAKQSEVLQKLNELHARGRAFARQHGVPLGRPKK